MKSLISISCNNCVCIRVKYIFLMDFRSSKDVSKKVEQIPKLKSRS
jgi:hypothetical protein